MYAHDEILVLVMQRLHAPILYRITVLTSSLRVIYNFHKVDSRFTIDGSYIQFQFHRMSFIHYR